MVSAEVTLLVAFGREMAGAETPTMTSLSGVSAGVAETAGGLTGPLAPAGFPL